MSSRASREQLVGQLSPNVRASLGSSPLVRRLLLSHGLKFGTHSEARGTTAQPSPSDEPNFEPHHKKPRTGELVQRASLRSDLLSAAITDGDPPTRQHLSLPDMLPAARRHAASDVVLRHFRDNLVSSAVSRVERCGRQPVIRQVHSLVKRWHEHGLRQVSSRAAELGVLRAVLVAVLDAPEPPQPARTVDLDAASALLCLCSGG